jgi:hypothetical protein
MVPIGHRNFTAMFHANEIYELKNLFSHSIEGKDPLNLIKLDKIDAQLSLN